MCLLHLWYELSRNYNLQIWKNHINKETCTAAPENNFSDASFHFTSIMIFFSENHHDKTLWLRKLSVLDF